MYESLQSILHLNTPCPPVCWNILCFFHDVHKVFVILEDMICECPLIFSLRFATTLGQAFVATRVREKAVLDFFVIFDCINKLPETSFCPSKGVSLVSSTEELSSADILDLLYFISSTFLLVLAFSRFLG